MYPDRKTPPPIRDAVDYKLSLKPYEFYKLRNGIPVYALNLGAEDVMMMEFIFYAGNCYEKSNLVAASANYLIKNGTKEKNAFQINEHFDYYGAYVNRSCQNETASVTLHCLTKHLTVLLPVIRELLTDAVFPEEELEIFKQNSRQRLAVNMKKCDFVANRLIDMHV